MDAFAPSRLLTDVRLAFLAGFTYDASASEQETSSRSVQRAAFEWVDPHDVTQSPLQGFRIPEEFLVQKQIFTEGRAPIPSWPPLRGRARDRLALNLNLAIRALPLDCEIFVACFAEQQIVVLLAAIDFREISLDDLIFVKQGKWYPCADLMRPVSKSYSECFRSFLDARGFVGVTENSWPIFDFIELCDSGPAVGRGPNENKSLTVAEHWGLLVGDEGYRLIDEGEAGYAASLTDSAWRFRGRKDWLYNFSPTSCLAFISSQTKSHRAAWREFYTQTVGNVEMLDRYLGFTTRIPTLQDGIPLLVEICLLRYAELRRISNILRREEGAGLVRVWHWMWARVKGATPLEQAVTKLQHLDFYQESALWIIGGPYTERLYQYASIRKRINAAVDDAKVISADVRVFYLGLVSLVVAVIALVVGLWKH